MDIASFGKRKDSAVKGYKTFVSQGKGQPSPWVKFRNQVYFGDDRFVEKMHSLIDGDKELSEIPSSQRRPIPKGLAYYDGKSESRNDAIMNAYMSGGYRLKEVGDYFGLHYYSTVSGIIKNHKSKT